MTIMFSSDTICYFNAGSSDTAELLGNYLSKILIKNGFSDIAPVLLCIGSDRVTGDSLVRWSAVHWKNGTKKASPCLVH